MANSQDPVFASATFREVPNPGHCEQCETTEGVKAVPGMTAYATSHLEPKTRYDWLNLEFDRPEDPNRDVFLCPDCAEEHVEYWNSMWDEYHRGLL